MTQPETRLRLIAAAVVAAGVATLWLGSRTGLADALRTGSLFALGAAAQAATATRLSGPQRSLLGAQPWLNTSPLRAEDLRGKVVLVNFWTYSCINSLRPLPYVRNWAEKYKDRGLVVVGVHTPEFGFEKDISNVRRAVGELGVGYPVVLDSDYSIWRAYGNQAWPAFYFLGADGRVRRQKLGEGGYEESERLLQSLLAEARGGPVSDAIVPIAGRGPQAAPDWENLASQETYIGYGKAARFASPVSDLARDRVRLYRPPERLSPNRWSLAGAWRVGEEFATLTGTSGTIGYRLRARDLNLVMAPPPEGRTVRFRVRIDGADPGPDHGFDTDAHGWGRLDEPRMYQLVRQARGVRERTFEIEFFDGGARAYVFTFG